MGRHSLELLQRRVLCDVSKRLARTEASLGSPRVDVTVLHLVRDPRAVAYSSFRKTRRSMQGDARRAVDTAVRSWVDYQDRCEVLRKRFPQSWLTIRYEDLAMSPSLELSRILASKALAFEPAMLRYRARTDHGLGGNRLRFDGGDQVLLDAQYLDELDAPAWSRVTERTVEQRGRFGYPSGRESTRERFGVAGDSRR
ncbi:MAG: sulfotransferase [Planctomycetota bacterium]